MLAQLQIRDLAVIEEVTLDLGSGFTVLTGETGAGKSILVDALALALGERGDAGAIRAGASRLEVLANFEPGTGSAARCWLQDNELADEGDGCLMRRVIGTDGRSKAWINGRPVPVQTLRELGATLVDICGQQDYQSLRHRAAQRGVLDDLAGHDDLLLQVREAHAAWLAAEAALEQLAAAQRDRDSRVELLTFQVGELSALQPRTGEYAGLEREHTALAHRLRIGAALDLALARAYDDEDGSAQAAIGVARRSLDDVLRFDPELEAPLRLLAEAEAQVGEAADMLRHRLARLDPDPGREALIADRLAALRDSSRKHRCGPDDLPALLDRLQEELAALTGGEITLERLARTARQRRSDLEALAATLSAGRQAAARSLGATVTRNMATLGMPGGRFEVRLAPLADGSIAAHGADDVEFLVTANAGQPLAPMSRIASGGELSRLNLAIQVVATSSRGAPTLVFDEVDAGVGGAVAEMVGRRLRELSKGRQVLCITHLPQVAALAEHQATVSKTTRAGKTTTAVRLLSPAERVEETARMLGGMKITDQTRAHAEEMLAAGRNGDRRDPSPAEKKKKKSRA
ncbi:MAG: DNA repair protein RecN [Gammaproteobacteria bacterium]|nr:DNA repair protein RecN [Gammaproteobacteria bacterium]